MKSAQYYTRQTYREQIKIYLWRLGWDLSPGNGILKSKHCSLFNSCNYLKVKIKQNYEIRYNACFVCESLGNCLCQITFETTGERNYTLYVVSEYPIFFLCLRK